MGERRRGESLGACGLEDRVQPRSMLGGHWQRSPGNDEIEGKKGFAKRTTGRELKINCTDVKMLQRSKSSTQWPLVWGLVYSS